MLTNSIDMVKLLMQHGAREGLECKFQLVNFDAIERDDEFPVRSDGSKETLSRHLMQLLSEAERQLDESSAPAPSTSPVRVDWDKHIATWKRRVRILRKMKAGLEQLSKFVRETVTQAVRFSNAPLSFARAAQQPEPGTSGSGRRTGGAHLVASTRNRLRRHLHQIQRCFSLKLQFALKVTK